MLKVNLIVVSGKPEGKVIPLTAPVFRIGRDETCQLRPNSVEVSRQHTELTVTDTEVIVKDLGSRNGTLVNGTLLTGPHRLRSGELLKVGPLTFAVAIHGEVAAAPAPSRPAAAAAEAAAWLVADNARPTPDRPSGVYDGDTLTIDAYKGAAATTPTPPSKPASSAAQPVRPASSASQPVAKPPSSPAVPSPFENIEFDPIEEGVGDPEEETQAPGGDGENGEAEAEATEEYVDESNPFHVAKKKPAAKAEEAAKASYKDTSDAANDILRKMLERRRASRS